MAGPVSEQRPGAVDTRVSLPRRLAASTTWAIHMAVVAFLLTGWALPWPLAWWTYAVAAPFIQLGWIVFDDYCWLSIVEAKLRGESLVVRNDDGEEESRAFVGELIESITRIPVSRRVSNWISYSVLWGGFTASCIRLWNV